MRSDIVKLDDVPFLKTASTGAITYSASGQVKRIANMKSYIATNTGGDVVYVDGHVLYPGNPTLAPGGTNGDSLQYSSESNEVYLRVIEINFLGTGGNPQVTIDQVQFLLDKTI